ncbi:ferritin-like domain-containing protein [Longimicrobium sp.]|uniref:YciE/YciF ferroxidase family protein n=1 Tax=Longimicrobium sp. TaxID=2029185 RepID=UPI002E3176E5|nr:ferritin-like domain-containing protein [Longimicrobium sp.]HEX6037849.1 ferritin-like domain-containing protein [Longimicrobium sp.]
MAASDMKELLTHELGDLLYAEQLILKMLGTLTREVKNPEMLSRVQEHIGETEEQIERLRRAFESIGEKAKAEKCDAAIGLKEEHDSFKKEEKPSKAMLEAFDLGNSLRVEHYEIAGYRSAIAVATALGERECVALLSESLREEEAMATFIERNSVKALKGLATGMDLASGAAEVVLNVENGGSSSGSSRGSGGGSKSSSATGKTASKSASRSSGSRGNGSSTSSDSSRSSGSRGSSSSSGGSKSGGSSSRSSGASKTASKSSSRSSGGSSSSRTTAERSSGSRSSGGKSNGSSSGGSKSGGGSSRSTASKSTGASKSGGGKSGSSRSRSGSGSGARA